ncbi:MAG: phosphoglycolate phosphatase [Bacteroidota bacterium]|nr:phosphoglycolate phosphatase [Bacteroidota bacterium]
MPVLILFDIDGTILKLKYGISKNIFIELLSDLFNINISQSDLPGFAGKTDLQIFSEISKLNHFPYSIIENNLSEIRKQMTVRFKFYCTAEHIEELPGAANLIDMTNNDKDYTIGLLTGNFIEIAYMKLNALHLGKYFPFGSFGSDEADRWKLPPIAISRANKLIGENIFSSENTMIIGDSLLDIDCARRNGIPVAAVATGGTEFEELAEYQPELIFQNLSDTNYIFSAINSFWYNRK